jgi:hypothetical protein
MWALFRPQVGLETNLRDRIHHAEAKLGELPDAAALARERAKHNTVAEADELASD